MQSLTNPKVMSEIHGTIEKASVSKNEEKELWSFKIKDEHQEIIYIDSLIRHFPDPILSEETFTTVNFKSEDEKKLVEVMIPKREIPESLSDITIFEGKSAVIKYSDESL